MSARGRALLADWEGVELHEYRDSAGLPTIGVGHLLLPGEVSSGMLRIGDRSIAYSAGITLEDALELLANDLDRFERCVASSVEVTLAQRQFDALVSFAFNLGTGAFKTSTLLRILNEGGYAGVPAQLRRWVNAGGQRIPGLINRREKEIALWERGYDAAAAWRPPHG